MTEMQLINLGMPVLKEGSSKWFVGMVEYIWFSNNPQLIANGFVHSGISLAMDARVDIGSESEDSSTEDDLFSVDYDSCEESSCWQTVQTLLQLGNQLVFVLVWFMYLFHINIV